MSARSTTTNAERDRLLGDVARLGIVESVDLTAARVTVAIGDLVTGPLPWQAQRAGSVLVWAPPSIGEQVLLICPEGDVAAGVVLAGFYSESFSAPASDEKVCIVFADGSVMTYDHEAHELEASLVSGGSVRIHGDLIVTGKVTATEDVLAAGVSLKSHRHTGVQAGAGLTQPPQASA